MANLPTPDDRVDPVEVTSEHRLASSELLEQLCREVSSKSKAERQLYVRVGHYEQPGFLNPKLYGFWMLPVLSSDDAEREIVGLDQVGFERASERMRDWLSPDALQALLTGPGAAIQPPNESSESNPSIWTCVLNSAIETQIESTLTALAMLVARQDLTQHVDGENIASLPTLAERVDDETTKLISDEIRNNGWRSACHAIRSRATSTDSSLHVDYKNPLLQATEVRARMPLARHVYNTLPGVSSTIDKVVNVLTQGWTIAGPGPEQVLRAARDMFETSGIPALTAHAVRDGLVCGIGVLSMASVPLTNPWLIRPEDVEELASDSVVVRTADGVERIHPVLPIKGGSQLGSTLGLSLLEPMVITAANRDMYLRTLLSAKIMQLIPRARAQVGDWPERSQALAEEQLSALQKTSDTIFNPAALRMPSPATSIYSPGMELMRPDVSRISLGRS